MSSFLPKLAILGAAFATGNLLRSSGVLTKEDAKAASLCLRYGTLPALALQTFLSYGFLWWEGPAMALTAIAASGLYCIVTWLVLGEKRKSEKSVLAACSASISSGSIALGFVEAAFGAIGLHMALLWDLGSTTASSSIAWFMLSQGGNVTPERYTHMDGGVYRGSWRGGKKEGLGVYAYPSGARYEGRWEDNLKDGLGVYYFPKGGWYEGEWRQGEREGAGLRVKSSGRVQAGMWHGLDLVEERAPEDLHFVSASARDVASAARRVVASGRGAGDFLLQLLRQPLLWAALAAAASATANYQIPVMVDLVTAHLASAHIPLAILVFGLQTDLQTPAAKQVKEYAYALAVRYIVPLLLAAVAALALSQRYTDAVAIAAICSMGPISEQVAYWAQLFQLSEAVAGKALSGSRLISIGTLAALTLCLVLSTPPTQALSRLGLAASLAITATLLAAAGLVAAWQLSQKGGNRAISRQSRSELTAATATQPSRRAETEPIPIGIAWQEIEEDVVSPGTDEAAATEAGDASDYKGRIDDIEEAAAKPVESTLGDGEQAGDEQARAGTDQLEGISNSEYPDDSKPDSGQSPSASHAAQGSEILGLTAQDSRADRRRRGRRRDPRNPQGLNQVRDCLRFFGSRHSLGFHVLQNRPCKSFLTQQIMPSSLNSSSLHRGHRTSLLQANASKSLLFNGF